ncbi:heterokaryon incompatibility protein-domain-containing protein [Xylaria bambusicola]|uniref:heterokaryon incompatibility protein-domain-containing protein n=1 Tax=Xylaria bambusicola TaxID=326684 RepID=UPI002007E18A|nr:heterokaryon incompatibility protein-domain-containing protein [Xylaria bambusicola]KAI0503169.1 heterokaryon incompatibility protein-domain-containing protein [Xylaria bambusicola]
MSPVPGSLTVQNWLRVCLAQHGRCRNSQKPQSELNLIDCRSQRVLSIAEIGTGEPDYLALSYDAIDVVLKLGYYYLWIDKYCVDQHDKCKKHEQLMHMGHVYKNATLTIVAAAGHDESYGLPGVSSTRLHRQTSFKNDGDGYELRSTLPLPHSSIAKSKWASRGWTYQEAILSRRRLVFTDEQLYFECNSTSCVEAFDISFDNTFSASEIDHERSIRSPLFSLYQLSAVALSGRAARLNNFSTYTHCAEQYSKRTLTFDRDSLVAFSGIIRVLESITPFPVRHIWGVPFFHPDDDNTGFDYLAYLMLGLCWRHVPSEKPPRRRHDLPSWSWTGWEGALTWPRLSKDSDIRSSTWAETSISLASDSSESVPELYHKSTDAHLLAQSNKSLHIRTSAISPSAFVFNESSSSLVLITGGEVKLYPSKSELDASKVFRRIQSARYGIIRLATIDGNTYMMLIKRYRNAYYRIGIMVVKDLYLTYSLFTSKIETFKLR